MTSRGIVTLTNNTIYRLGDVVAQRGHLWLFSALAILSRPAFRRTLLRDLLSRLASHDGTRLSDMPVAAAERLAARNWTCYNATFGGKLSWNGLPLTRHWNCALWDAMQPALPFLTFERDYCRIVRALAAIVRSHLGQNDTSCRAAPANTAAVHVRMGDKRDVWQPIKSSIGDRGLGLAVPLHQQAASLTCTNSTLVMVGLINYGPERMPSGSRAFAYSDHIQQESELYVRQLWRVLDRCVGTGGRWRWRSDASADADLCFLATADYFVRLTRGPPNAARAAFAPSAARAAPVPRASRTARVPPPSPAPPPLSLRASHFFNPPTSSILPLLQSSHSFHPPTSSILPLRRSSERQVPSAGSFSVLVHAVRAALRGQGKCTRCQLYGRCFDSGFDPFHRGGRAVPAAGTCASARARCAHRHAPAHWQFIAATAKQAQSGQGKPSRAPEDHAFPLFHPADLHRSKHRARRRLLAARAASPSTGPAPLHRDLMT